MAKPKILIVDDEPGSIDAFRMILKDDYEIFSANSAQQGLQIVNGQDIQLVLLDIVMPEMDGIAALQKIKEIDKNLAVVMVTATKSIRSAVEAMQLGAFDYVTKPFEVNEAKLIVGKAMQSRNLIYELEYLHNELSQEYNSTNLIGASKEIREVFRSLKELGNNKSPVLIIGECGTGKEFLARAIHFNSPRKARPFVAVRCAALSEDLLESELFGQEKDAFADSSARKIGKFELAYAGTLFLDEIDRVNQTVQAKILSALKQQEIVRIGAGKPISIDVKLIFSTKEDLNKAVREKTFLENLYRRINEVSIKLRPLRERKEDIASLANCFLNKYNKEIKPQVKEISPNALAALTDYQWPGNVRELKNVVERVLISTDNRSISVEDLPHGIGRKLQGSQ